MQVLGSSRVIRKDFSRPSIPPRVTAWGSACRSADQLLKDTVGVFGPRRTPALRERLSHSQFRAPTRMRRTHSVLACSNHAPRQLLGYSRGTCDGATSPHNGH